MRWANVGTIFRREVRDQLRDRRTLFMVFVLPILLYPVMGIGMLQFFVAFDEKPRTVVVIGAEHLPKSPRLLNEAGDGFAADLLKEGGMAGKLQVRVEPPGSKLGEPGPSLAAMRQGSCDAVLTIPADVAKQLAAESATRMPINYISADEASQLTYLRVREILGRWNEQIVQARLARDHKSTEYVEPVRSQGTDLSTKAESGGSVWARVFPFLLVLMALTGAFYPSVDLCAGEKERGTMETLLISPASRTEIVAGKFLTVVLASVCTAVLNLLSMGLTGMGLAQKLAGGGMEPPSLQAGFWMAVLLLPLAVFFSAICLALAVLAKSMKEGQYYMTPLYMVSLPLILLTLAPGVELSPFYSMVPITGVGLLLRSLILGQYGVARVYFIPVVIPMLVYGAVALRWAVDQFQREDVLFREAERFDLGGWVRHLLRHKEPTPTGGMALLCFTLMLCLSWFAIQAIGPDVPATLTMGLGHLIYILGPPVAMTLLLTSSPTTTLRLRRPAPGTLAIGIALALALNPAVRELAFRVGLLFPPSKLVQEQMEKMMGQLPGLGVALLLFAIVPAITEEVAFRGFILSGLERGHRTRSAILISAFLFGFLHVLISLFNQFFTATLLGVVLGLLAVRSGSLYPGVIFHFLNNALGVLLGVVTEGRGEWLGRLLFRDPAHGLFHLPILVVATGLGGYLVVRLYRMSSPRMTTTSVRREAWPLIEGVSA